MLYHIFTWQADVQSVTTRPQTPGAWWVTCPAAGLLSSFSCPSFLLLFLVSFIFASFPALFRHLSCLQVVVERCGLDHQKRPRQGQVGLKDPPCIDSPCWQIRQDVQEWRTQRSFWHLFAPYTFVALTALVGTTHKRLSMTVVRLHSPLSPVHLLFTPPYLEANCWH